MSDNPTEIYREILLRVPAEPLLRFRCVCKDWRNIIDDPDFVRLHADRQMGAEDMLMLRSNKRQPHLFSVSLASFDHRPESARVMQIDALRIRNITGRGVPRDLQFPRPCCDGLLLIWHQESDKAWFVWNPFMGDWLELPLPEQEQVHRIDFVGIGYDRATYDYKVVRVSHDSKNVLATLIYSFKSNEWHRIENIPGCNCRRSYVNYIGPSVGMFANGALHWILGDMECIVALDLTSETYRRFHLPSALSALPKGIQNMPEVQLSALGGCLFISYWHFRTEPPHHHVLDMWILKDREGDNMWTKLVSYQFPFHSVLPNGIHGAIAYIKSKEQVVFQNAYDLKWLDMERKTSKAITIQNMDFGFSSQVLPASLIRLTPHADEGNTSKGKRKRGRKMYGNDRLCFNVALQGLWSRKSGGQFFD